MSKPETYGRCIRCNRKLRTENAKQRGYGDTCWRKHLEEERKRSKNMFDCVNK